METTESGAALTEGERRLLAEIDTGDRPFVSGCSPAFEAALRARGLTLTLLVDDGEGWRCWQVSKARK